MPTRIYQCHLSFYPLVSSFSVPVVLDVLVVMCIRFYVLRVCFTGPHEEYGSASLQREKERNFMREHGQDVLVYAEGDLESSRTKVDVLLTYGLLQERPDGELTQARPDILQSSQMAATWVHIRVSQQSIAFVNDWLSACLDQRG